MFSLSTALRKIVAQYERRPRDQQLASCSQAVSWSQRKHNAEELELASDIMITTERSPARKKSVHSQSSTTISLGRPPNTTFTGRCQSIRSSIIIERSTTLSQSSSRTCVNTVHHIKGINPVPTFARRICSAILALCAWSDYLERLISAGGSACVVPDVPGSYQVVQCWSE